MYKITLLLFFFPHGWPFKPLCGFLFFFSIATFLLQCHMNEMGPVFEEGPHVEVFAVRRLHAVILDAGVAVEAWPRVNVVGAVGGVQHVRYPQVD